MIRRVRSRLTLLGLVLLLSVESLLAHQQAGCDEEVSAQIKVDSGHPWRPPFGLDRVGARPVARFQLSTENWPSGDYLAVTYRDGKESERKPLIFRQDPPPGQRRTTDRQFFFSNAPLTSIPREVALLVRC